MKTRLNGKEGNNPFDVKKETYNSSELWITNMIAEYDEWSTNSIKSRQEKLAEIAIEVWILKLN